MAARGSPYVDRHGFARRCCACGAFKNHDEPARWDQLGGRPVALDALISHGLCEPCFVLRHGELTGSWSLGSTAPPK